MLDAAIDAIGGPDALQAVKTVRRQMAGDWIGSGQHPHPYPVVAPTLTIPPSNGRNAIVSVIDYAGGRWLEEAVESDFTGDSITRINAVTGNAGFETITDKQEKPFYRTYGGDDGRKFRRHPEGLLSRRCVSARSSSTSRYPSIDSARRACSRRWKAIRRNRSCARWARTCI